MRCAHVKCELGLAGDFSSDRVYLVQLEGSQSKLLEETVSLGQNTKSPSVSHEGVRQLSASATNLLPEPTLNCHINSNYAKRRL